MLLLLLSCWLLVLLVKSCFDLLCERLRLRFFLGASGSNSSTSVFSSVKIMSNCPFDMPRRSFRMVSSLAISLCRFLCTIFI